jgi:molecular chaperone GrpE
MTEPMENNQELPADDAAPALDSPEARIADLEKQVAELKDRALREMADAENTRRRAIKDREDTAKYAVGKIGRAHV